MFQFMLIFVFHSLLVKINEAITIENYQVEVFNARTKYTIDLRERIDQAVYINQSDSVTFSCTATGSSFYVALLRNDNEFKREYLHYGQTGNVTLTYTQTDMGCSDAAKFTCRAGSVQEWPSITAIIIVKCHVLPVRFKSSNVNKIVGAHDLKFRCEKSKDVDITEPYNLTIRRNSHVLMTSSLEPFIELNVKTLRCEDMGTYSCETKTERFTNYSLTDLFVHYCPPLLSQLKKTVKSDIGSSVHLTLNATMSKKLCIVTVLYKEYQTECDKCENKLCVKIVSKENWVTEINISIFNLTEEDFGNQNLSICTETVGQLHCGHFSLLIKKNAPLESAVNATNSVSNRNNSTLEMTIQVLNVSESSNTVKSSDKGRKASKPKKSPNKVSHSRNISKSSRIVSNKLYPAGKITVKKKDDEKTKTKKRKSKKNEKKMNTMQKIRKIRRSRNLNKIKTIGSKIMNKMSSYRK